MTPLGIDPGTVRLVAQRLNHYATPGPDYVYNKHFIHLLGVQLIHVDRQTQLS